MRGNAVFRAAVHLHRANLHLERAAVRAHHRGVQRLIEIVLGHGDIVLEPSRHLRPQGVHNAQRGIAVLLGVDDHAHGDQIGNLLERLVLRFHLAVDGIKVLGPAVDFLHVNVLFLHAVSDGIDDLVNPLLALGALHTHLFHKAVVALRIDVAQGKVFQLPLYRVYAQPVRQRRINVQRFAGDGNLPLGLLRFERAHVVQPVGQLDQHHADVLRHGDEHLADGLRLLLFAGEEVHARELGNAVYHQRNFAAEVLLDGLHGAAVHVLDTVVQKPGGDRRGIEHQVGQNQRHVGGMREIRLAGHALLILVRVFGKPVGALNDAHILVRMIFLHVRDQFVQRRISGVRMIVHELTFLSLPVRASPACGGTRDSQPGRVSQAAEASRGTRRFSCPRWSAAPYPRG